MSSSSIQISRNFIQSKVLKNNPSELPSISLPKNEQLAALPLAIAAGDLAILGGCVLVCAGSIAAARLNSDKKAEERAIYKLLVSTGKVLKWNKDQLQIALSNLKYFAIQTGSDAQNLQNSVAKNLLSIIKKVGESSGQSTSVFDKDKTRLEKILTNIKNRLPAKIKDAYSNYKCDLHVTYDIVPPLSNNYFPGIAVNAEAQALKDGVIDIGATVTLTNSIDYTYTSKNSETYNSDLQSKTARARVSLQNIDFMPYPELGYAGTHGDTTCVFSGGKVIEQEYNYGINMVPSNVVNFKPKK